ncbi:MAG: SH3 domain-containing protein [Caldilineaceae bacterium]|nr:SH3 domain-containing protein [Caldilineaceae bacterium]
MVGNPVAFRLHLNPRRLAVANPGASGAGAGRFVLARRLFIILALVLLLAGAVGCGGKRAAPEPDVRAGVLSTPSILAMPTHTPVRPDNGSPGDVAVGGEPGVSHKAGEPEVAIDSRAVIYGFAARTTANLRMGAGAGYPIEAVMPAGQRLGVAGRNAVGDWLLVENPDHYAYHSMPKVAGGEVLPSRRIEHGSPFLWVHAPLTDMDAATLATLPDLSGYLVTGRRTALLPNFHPKLPFTMTARVGTVSANLRAGPGTGYETVGLAALGMPVSIVDHSQEGDWLLITMPTNHELPIEQVWIYGPMLDRFSFHMVWDSMPSTSPSFNDPIPPTPAPTPRPPLIGAGCATPLGRRACLDIPDHPERGHPNAPIGHAVLDSGVGVLWHSPDNYEPGLSGLDYDFELVFTDVSTQWDWGLRDPAACENALRAHMGFAPRDYGLQRLELRLTDPFVDDYGLLNDQPWLWRWDKTFVVPSTDNGPYTGQWPLNATGLLPDTAIASYGCYRRQPDGQAVCDIMPTWGNSHSLHLSAAVTRAIANTVTYMSSRALARQEAHKEGITYDALQARVRATDAYLFPLLYDGTGNPAGWGPCADVWRAG